MNGAILQQVFVVDYVVQCQMCGDCHRVEAKDFWKAVIQVRQKTLHKKTFYYLEQLILKYGMHQNTLRIKEIHDGLDFYYSSKQHAQKMVEFLQCTVPCRYKASQRLISQDIHSNTYNYKSTFSVEIVPVCKDNVVCLSPKLAQSLGNMNQICVCIRVTSAIHLIDPNTLQVADVDGSTFWNHPFNSLCHPKQLEEFIVMDCSIVRDIKRGAGAGMISKKHTLGEVWVQKTSELNTDKQYFCRTHLGHLLNPGDLVLGFDLANCNLNDEHVNKMNSDRVPDVVLIKKSYDRTKRQRRRNWKLKELARERENMDTDDERQYQDFLEDLEEDETIRKNVNIYRDSAIPVESDTDDEGAPRISLAEMLEDLHISQDATGGEGPQGAWFQKQELLSNMPDLPSFTSASRMNFFCLESPGKAMGGLWVEQPIRCQSQKISHSRGSLEELLSLDKNLNGAGVTPILKDPLPLTCADSTSGSPPLTSWEFPLSLPMFFLSLSA
ncbi:60S ribosomal export protein NMD3 isoform X3 [Callithrix jacchus]|nr:60S ribosomal export protein NMD3 isoform X5 [Callithrix jacchus]